MVNLVKKKERKNLNKKNGQFTFKGGEELMSEIRELREIITTICFTVGCVVFLGGLFACFYGERVYVGAFTYETVYPYRSSCVPLIIWGLALMLAGVALLGRKEEGET